MTAPVKKAAAVPAFARTPQSSPESPRGRAARPDSSTLGVLFGLVVIWGVLFVIFRAHELSSRMGVQAGDAPALAAAAGIDPRARLLAPVTMYAPDLSPRDTLEGLLAKMGLEAEPQFLEQISSEPAALDFEDRPLHEVILRLLGDPGRGLALAGNRLEFIGQKLAFGESEAIAWQGEPVIASDRPLTIVPSADLAIWFTVRRVATPAEGAEQIQLELWQGAVPVGMARTPLSEDGRAAGEIVVDRRYTFMLRRLPTADRFELRLAGQPLEPSPGAVAPSGS